MRSIIVVLLLCACARGFDVPSAANRTAGTACEQSGQCISGACVDGICCAKKCAATESCAVSGQIGACAPRPNGATCSADAQCPSGHCADSVCCDTACTGTCRSCKGDAASAAGACHAAPDNTDGRKDCGLCSACFQLACAPALPGTDPNQRCPQGQVCGASQSCGLPGGAACKVDGDCAQGQCFTGHCEQLSLEHIFVEPMVAAPTGRNVRAVAASPTGGIAVAFGEYTQADPLSSPSESDLFLALRSPQGAWIAVDLFEDKSPSAGILTADVAYLGPTAFVIAYDHDVSDSGCTAPGPAPCGVFGTLVAPGGQVGRPEKVDGAVRFTRFVSLRTDDSGRLVAAYDGDRDNNARTRIFLRRRDVTPAGVTWTELGAVDPGIALWSDVSWSFELVGGAPVFFIAQRDAGVLQAMTLAGVLDGATLPNNGAVACRPSEPVAMAGGGKAFLSVDCALVPLFGTWDPASHWSLAYAAQGTDRTDPLGLVGGTPAWVNFYYSNDVPAVIEAHLDIGARDQVVFHPRGAEETAGARETVGPDGLPVFAIVAGPQVASGSTTVIVGLDLFLVRFHP